MKKIISIIILIALAMAGCSQREAFNASASDEIEAPSLRKIEVTLPTKGTIQVTIARLRKTLDEEVLVSTGVPFGVGQLKSDKDIAFFDGENEIPITTKVLARWPYDDSIRSVLVQFRVSLDKDSKYKPMTMKWGDLRVAQGIMLTEVDWEFPEGFILLPAKWLCDSDVTGEQVPMFTHQFTKYDQNILDNFPSRMDTAWTGDVRKDGYYDIGHVFYQLYARSGEIDYFKAARRELVHYRDTDVIQSGPEKGSTKYRESRYIFVQAMVDDYLLTGDERSLKTAGYMAEHLKKSFNPGKAFFSRNATRFWTEREQAFPFLGIITYFELTGDKEYLDIASEWMENLYKTQMEWPERGGFIHNLYSHDPEEGARRDEYGGSPFMTGLLLEPIIEYHKLTGSKTAEESIFKALDWLIKEGLANDGKSFYYMTSDKARSEKGQPDLNLLTVHAFGYGYKISGYKRQDYLETGSTVFQCGIDKAFLRTRKHFNQNYRSSGHFLAYISRPIAFSAKNTDSLFYHGFGNFVKKGASFDNWNIDKYKTIRFSYKSTQGAEVGLCFKTSYDDWIYICGTTGYNKDGFAGDDMYTLADDGEWHEISIDIKEAIHKILPGVNMLKGFQFFTSENAGRENTFWIKDFSIGK